jgi:hypothetical protein
MARDLAECYSVLGLSFGASPDTVKQAYRDLVKVWHPDRFPNDPRLQAKGRDQLKNINTAYERIQASWAQPPSPSGAPTPSRPQPAATQGTEAASPKRNGAASPPRTAERVPPVQGSRLDQLQPLALWGSVVVVGLWPVLLLIADGRLVVEGGVATVGIDHPSMSSKTARRHTRSWYRVREHPPSRGERDRVLAPAGIGAASPLRRRAMRGRRNRVTLHRSRFQPALSLGGTS